MRMQGRRKQPPTANAERQGKGLACRKGVCPHGTHLGRQTPMAAPPRCMPAAAAAPGQPVARRPMREPPLAGLVLTVMAVLPWCVSTCFSLMAQHIGSLRVGHVGVRMCGGVCAVSR